MKAWNPNHYATRELPLFTAITSIKGTACICTSWQIDGETMETVTDLIFFFAPKSLQMVTAAMKFKDSFSLGER